MLIIEFSYNFLYVWNCMKLHDKKFLIYGNCMTRSFGQPGTSAVNDDVPPSTGMILRVRSNNN